MRVISQDDAIDIPYEMAAFHLAGETIRMDMVDDTRKRTLMAQYETPEKAEKAMEMFRKAYTGTMPNLVVNRSAKLDEENTRALIDSIEGVFIKPANAGDIDIHILPRVFQFPTDDEIEVEE